MVTMTMVVVTEFIIESRVELVEKSPLKLLEKNYWQIVVRITVRITDELMFNHFLKSQVKEKDGHELIPAVIVRNLV